MTTAAMTTAASLASVATSTTSTALNFSYSTSSIINDTLNDIERSRSGRRRWNHTEEMCIPLAIHQFPEDLIGNENRKKGGVLIHIFAALYVFGCLAYLCDAYFVPALEVLTERLNIQPEIAGATFMAIGSSSPELFTSMVGVYVAEDDVGVGTIIGSAVFNILFVIGCCILVSPSSVKIDVYPIVRDAAFYTLSLIPLAAICIDGHVDWYDALALVLMYGVYILMMYHSVKIEKLFYKAFPMAIVNRSDDDEEKAIGESTPILSKSSNSHKHDAVAQCKAHEAELSGNSHHDDHHHRNGLDENGGAAAKYIVNGNEIQVTITDTSMNAGEKNEEEDDDTCLSEVYPPDGKFKKLLWLLGLPVIVLFCLTIPNASKRRWRKWYPLTFICSLVYIAALSYVLVYMVTIIGYTIGVPDIVMGLVMIACGASVPDALASMIVARHGKARMSISNCIGSNIFDILLGLGLPWLMKTLVTDHGDAVPIMSGSIKFTVFILIGSVVAMMFVFLVSRWKLRWPAGLMLITCYLGFITVSCLFEMNVFGPYNLPQCE
eukprot:gene8877-9827_t